MFIHCRPSDKPIFLTGQDYYDLPKNGIRANRNIYHVFTTNNLREVQNLYQNKASMDMTHMANVNW